MKPKIIAIVQARSDSRRFPQKVLKQILNKPIIIHQLERIQRSKLIDKVILATSDESTDNHLAQIIEDYNFTLFRGNKNNVLKRFYDSVQALDLKDSDIIVRLTGDCPVHDAKIIDESIYEFKKQQIDYLANCINPIYPDGLDVEIFNYNTLVTAYKKATKLSDLEHVTPYIRNHNRFKTMNLNKKPLFPEWRFTVDEYQDFILIEKIYLHFKHNNFSLNDIINYLNKNKELLKLNSQFQRNEGYYNSIKKEIER